MHTARWAIPLCCFILFTGCGDDDTPTLPDLSETDPLVENTIGPDGGSLEFTGFTLDVPAAAFGADTTLKLFTAPSDDLPDDSITGVFDVWGLPDDIGAPLTLMLSCNVAPTGDPLIAIGREYDDDEGDVFVDFDYIGATYEGDTLTCTWQPPAGTVAKTDLIRDMFRLFGPGETVQTPIPDAADTKFLIIHPTAGSGQVPALGALLMEGYQTYEDFGFDMTFSGAPQTSSLWPMHVKFGEGSPGEDCYVRRTAINQCGDLPHSQMTLFKEHLTAGDLDALGLHAKARMAELVLEAQLMCTPAGNPGTQQLDWLSRAFVLWMEGYFSDDPNYIPDRLYPEYLDLEVGLLSSMVDDYFTGLLFGDMASALLKYLIADENNGVALMLRIADALRAQTPASRAFLDATAVESSEWWPGFLAAYIAGDIYDMHSSVFLDEATHYSMNEAAWEATTTTHYNDLSARLYRLSPAYGDWEEGAYLDIEVLSDDVNPDDFEALVFTLDGTDLALLTRGTDLRVTGLENLHEDGVGLLVAVVNSAWNFETLDDMDITLDLEVGQASTPMDAHMHIGVAVQFDTDGEGPNQSFDTAGNEPLNGTFDGQTFTGSYDWDNGEWYWSCSAVCRLDLEADPPRLLEWSFVKDISRPSTQYSVHIEAEGGEVDHYISGTGMEQFILLGEVVCDNVDDLTYTVTRNGEVTGTLGSYWCTPSSQITVNFYDWINE